MLDGDLQQLRAFANGLHRDLAAVTASLTSPVEPGERIRITLSPMPIIAVILLLATAAAGRNGAAFLLGRVTGPAVIGVVVLAVLGPTAHGGQRSTATWVSWLQLLLGVALLCLAVRQFRRRPAKDTEPAMPKWMHRVRLGTATFRHLITICCRFARMPAQHHV